MKSIYPLFVLFYLALQTIQVNAQSQLTPEVLFYKFDRSDNKVVNYASNPPSGTDTAIVMGGITQGNSPICAGALVGTGLSSTNDFLNTNWNTNLPRNFTISFRTSNIPSSATLFYVFGDINYGQLRLFTNGVAGPGNWLFRGPFTDLPINGAAGMSPAMITITYDTLTQDLIGYINGVFHNSVITSMNLPSTGATFKVGGYSANVGMPSGGLLEEFRLYSRALSSAEVFELYNGSNIDILDSSDIICDSSTPLTLKSNTIMDKYLWNTGETTDSILVNSSGLYKVNAILNCVSYADSIEIEQSYNYGPDLDIEICQFDYPYTSPFGQTFNAPGTYTITGTNALGCDSVVILNLATNAITFDTLIARTGTSLEIFSAPLGLDSYQWYDCSTNSPIPGANSANFTAINNGSYAVLLEKNFCGFMSECFDVFTLSNEAHQTYDLKVYPNPSNGLFTIEIPKQFSSNFELSIYSITGQKIQSKNYTSSSNILVELNVENGLYSIELKDKSGNIARRQIIKN